MSVISGKNGKVRFGGVDVSDCREWTLSLTGNVKAYASSSTSGGHSRVAGNKDATARFSVYLRTSSEQYDAFREGDSGTFDLFQNGTLYWSGTFMVETMEIGTPIESGDPVRIDVTIGQTANITPPA